MHPQLNTPYRPALYHCAGTYRVNVGPMFYVGSTTCFGSRNSDHRVRLERCEHPNKRLQVAYNASQSYEFIVLTEIPRKEDDSDKDHAARLKLNEQWLIDAHQGDPLLTNGSTSSTHNSTIGDWLKEKWQDPEFREKQITRLKARRGDAISEETRRKMSEAKKGANNAKSRPCIIHFNGESKRFASVLEAADHYGASQQSMDQWLKGTIPWPGTGPRKPKRTDLIGMTGKLIK
jgi:hypothetical protein